jgi:hypothetical protein
MNRRALLAAAAASVTACSDPGPCDDTAGRCIAIHVSSPTVTTIDQLDLDVLYGFRHDVGHTQLAGGRAVSLPVDTALALASDADAASLEVGIVAGGKLAGNLLGTGAASATLAPDEHATLAIVLAPPATCVDAAFYCGGDQLAGDPDTLYQCDVGAVPQARGRCTHGCTINPADDDACAPGPETCVDGGFYCGGNELAGDPRTLYTCMSGAGTAPRVCANGCVVMPAGSDDECR